MDIKIDFTVLPSYDPYTLFIVDNSYWLHIEEKPSIIEIKVPGTSKPVVNYFDKRAINNFNSINLALTCPTCDDLDFSELPDGIYDITLKGSPSTFFKNKKYLRTVRLELELSEQLIKANMGCEGSINKELKNKLTDIYMLIESAKANVFYDNLQTAQNEYKKAEQKLKNLKC